MGLGDLRELSGDARALAAYSLVYYFAYSLYGFIMVFYVLALGYSIAFFGALSAAGEAALVLSLPLAPHVASKVGARGTAFLGTAITALSIGASILPNPMSLGASFVGVGVGQAMISPSLSSLVSAAEPSERRTAAFAVSGAANQLGSFAGTALSGTLADLLQGGLGRVDAYRVVLALSAASAVPAAVIVRRGRADVRSRGNPWRMGEGSRRVAWRLILAAILIGAGAGFLIPYFPLQFKYRFGLSTAYISQIFSATNLAMAFLMLYMPELERRLGSLRSIVGSWTVATAAMLAMPSVGALLGAPAFSALYLIRTTIMNAIGPVQSSFELSMIDPGDRPAFSSLESMAWNAANAATVALGGVLMQMSLDAPFYVCGAFYLAAAAFYYSSFAHDGPGGIRTRDRRVKSPALYPG